MQIPVQYPTTATVDVVDTFFGTPVPDPYRWLEDDLNPDTRSWIEAQNKVTFDYIHAIPFRDAIRERVEKIWNYERFSAPFQEGKYTYFFKNDGLQNQSVLYRQQEDGEPEVFIDPNTFSEAGTTSLADISFSPDGSLAALQISEGGSDWRKVWVVDTETRLPVGDTLKNIKFSGIAWNQNQGFYYSSYDKPLEGSELSAKTAQHKLYYHTLGSDQNQDQLVLGGDDFARRYVGAYVTEGGRFLIVSAANTTTGNELYVQDLENESELIPIVTGFENAHSVVHALNDTLFVLTNLNAPNKRLVTVKWDAANGLKNAQDLIAETTMPLSVSTGSGKFFARYLKDAASYVVQYDVAGNLEREIELPGVGTANGFSGKWNQEQLYYNFTNYVYPPTLFSYNPTDGASSLYKQSQLAFNPEEYETYQVFYTSKDQTRIPLTITHRKGLERNGKQPVILYGYGGFNISLTPSFSPAVAAWLELGGIYAVANLRGGGEYGKEWHDGGRKLHKQNVFDDFISAAEYLHELNYANPQTTAISGGSNGGLLVGAVMAQRPDLFAVALPAVGVLDMLRYHTFTAGAGWAYDYGTAEDSEEMFQYLYGYSPLHNLKKDAQYPATMVTTGDHDDRVVPAHSYKFAARLQAVNNGPNPTLIRIDTKAGHGAGKPTSMLIDEVADKYAFAWFNMRLNHTHFAK